MLPGLHTVYSWYFSEGAKFCLFSGSSFGHEIKNPRILQTCVPLLSMRYSGHKKKSRKFNFVAILRISRQLRPPENYRLYGCTMLLWHRGDHGNI